MRCTSQATGPRGTVFCDTARFFHESTIIDWLEFRGVADYVLVCKFKKSGLKLTPGCRRERSYKYFLYFVTQISGFWGLAVIEVNPFWDLRVQQSQPFVNEYSYMINREYK